MRILTNLLPSGHHNRFLWRFTCCTVLVRLCEKDMIIACRFGRFPVISQMAERRAMPRGSAASGEGGVAGGEADGDCRRKLRDDGTNACTALLAPRSAVQAARSRTILVVSSFADRGWSTLRLTTSQSVVYQSSLSLSSGTLK